MKCVVLDFCNGAVDILTYDATIIDDVEGILLAPRYKLSDIQYMCVEEVKVNYVGD